MKQEFDCSEIWSLVSSLLPVAIHFSHDREICQAGNATGIVMVTSHQDIALNAPLLTPTL